MPTLVKLELVTLLANVLPLKVPAAVAMVMSALPSNAIPLIFFVVANLVAVAAFPVVFWFNVGTSATSNALKLGTPLAPLGAA